jgi:hypothetical protein
MKRRSAHLRVALTIASGATVLAIAVPVWIIAEASDSSGTTGSPPSTEVCPSAPSRATFPTMVGQVPQSAPSSSQACVPPPEPPVRGSFVPIGVFRQSAAPPIVYRHGRNLPSLAFSRFHAV